LHPSRAIRGATSRLLEGRRIVLGISGSIAAIEVPRIVRELLRHGAEVRAVMSAEAQRLVSAEAVEFATGHPAVVQLTGNVEHVTLLGPGEAQADLYLVAPATANTISKIAHGIDDTPVTSCASVALGGHVPMMLVPAMHSLMEANPAVRENVERLRSWGVDLLFGAAVEGESKLASPEEVAAAVLHRLARGPWVGRKVIVIGGASREPIDDVRSVSNESSGATAAALAVQAHYRGADVELWSGAMQVPVPTWIARHPWRSVASLLELARQRSAELGAAAAVFVPAALADFTLPPTPGKIRSRERAGLELSLTPAPKVLPELRRRAPAPARLVAFKLLVRPSPKELEAEARTLATESGADWVIGNDVTSVGASETAVLVVPRLEPGHWIRGSKSEVAGKLLDDLGREVANAPEPSAAGRGARHRRPRRQTAFTRKPARKPASRPA
jgi:phosphopantothenoylcysteine decarboxylase/phosphopantothenate--cysteine ligase